MENIDPKLVYEVIRDVLMLLAFGWMLISRGRSANKSEIEEVKKNHGDRLNSHAENLSKLNERMENMPKHDDLSKIYRRIDEVSATVGDVQSSVSGITATVDAIKTSVGLLNRHHMGDNK